MAIPTIRAKNQVTLPSRVMAQGGLRQGDPVEFEALSGGGVAIRPYGGRTAQPSALEWVRAVNAKAQGVADIDWEPERFVGELREVAW